MCRAIDRQVDILKHQVDIVGFGAQEVSARPLNNRADQALQSLEEGEERDYSP